jgi:hypothetical protein
VARIEEGQPGVAPLDAVRARAVGEPQDDPRGEAPHPLLDELVDRLDDRGYAAESEDLQLYLVAGGGGEGAQANASQLSPIA